MKNKFNNRYVVRWHSDVFGEFKSKSLFDYSLRGPLEHRFISICNAIIDHIAMKGNVCKVEKDTIDDGVVITEQLPNGVIVHVHGVWIENLE